MSNRIALVHTDWAGEEALGGVEGLEVAETVLLDEAIAVFQLVQGHVQLILGFGGLVYASEGIQVRLDDPLP